MAMVLPPFHLSTFALGILLARWQTLQQETKGRAENACLAGECRARTVGRRGCFERVSGSLVSRSCTLQQWTPCADFCGLHLGAIGCLHPVVALVVRAMASGPGELQLCSVPDPYADARLVSALSMGDACVLSGIPRTLYRAKCVEFPLFRDSRPPLVHGALPCAFNSKYSTHDLIMSSSSPVPVTEC